MVIAMKRCERSSVVTIAMSYQQTNQMNPINRLYRRMRQGPLTSIVMGMTLSIGGLADKVVDLPQSGGTSKNEESVSDPSRVGVVSKGLGNSWTSLNIGAHLLNPYHIVPVVDANNNVLVDANGQERHVVESSGSEAAFSFEFNFLNKAAWNPGRRAKFKKDGEWVWGADSLRNRIDIQGRIGYYVSGEKDLPSASTIVGSGDFAAELIGGFSLYQSKLGSDLSNGDSQTVEEGINMGGQTFGVQVAYAATTDKSAMDVHHRIMVGPAYTAAVPTRFLSGGDQLTRSILFELRLGPALIETVDFKSGNSREIAVSHRDLANFDLNLGFGIETEAWLPVSKTGNLVLGARIYGGPDPNTWSAYIAYSIDTDSVFGKLFN